MEVALLLLGTRLQVPFPKTLTDKVELAPFCTLESCTQKNSTSQHTSLGPISQTREIVCAPICTLKNCTLLYFEIFATMKQIYFLSKIGSRESIPAVHYESFFGKLSLSYVAHLLFFVLESWINHIPLDVAHK